MAPARGLSDDQRMALIKFRRSLTDVMQPQFDDHFLLRWLRARDWDAVAAEKMLRDSLQWRERWQVDKLLEWQPPAVLDKYFPSGHSGYDKDGAPIVVLPFAGLDIFGLLHSVSRRDFIMMTAKQLEKYVWLGRQQAQQHGDAARGIVAVIDMANFSLRPWAWRPAGEMVVTLLKMYEANYPEILKNCAIINAPKVFALAWSVVKNFLNERTLSKIQIYKQDPLKWQPALLEIIPADQLPRHFGGTMEDPPGDPLCSAKVNQGGKVPKELYQKNMEVDKVKENMESVVINKGGKLRLNFLAAQSGSFLKWEFRTEGHDIKFGVTAKDMDGNLTTIVSLKRVNSHQADEVGVISCPQPATYTVLFDNTYSYLRSKKVHYSIVMVPPVANDVEDRMLDDINDNLVERQRV